MKLMQLIRQSNVTSRSSFTVYTQVQEGAGDTTLLRVSCDLCRSVFICTKKSGFDEECYKIGKFSVIDFEPVKAVVIYSSPCLAMGVNKTTICQAGHQPIQLRERVYRLECPNQGIDHGFIYVTKSSTIPLIFLDSLYKLQNFTVLGIIAGYFMFASYTVLLSRVFSIPCIEDQILW